MARYDGIRWPALAALSAVALALAACGGPEAPPPGTVPPATGAQLTKYAEDIGNGVSRAKDAALYEYFCRNVFDSPCPADIDEQLDGAWSGTGNSVVDLVDAFARIRARLDRAGGSPEAPVTNSEYVKSLYRVVLGRDYDEGGFQSHLSFLDRTGEQKVLARKFLESAEFKTK